MEQRVGVIEFTDKRREMKPRDSIIEIIAWNAANETNGKTAAGPARASPAYLPHDFVPVPKVKEADPRIRTIMKKWKLSETILGRLTAFIGRTADPQDPSEGDWETEILPNGWAVLTRILDAAFT